MTRPRNSLDPNQVGRVTQIVSAALMFGILTFSGVAFVIGRGEGDGQPIVSFVGVGFAAIALVLQFFVPNALVMAQGGTLRQISGEERRRALGGLYMTRTLIVMAILEGAAMLNIVAYILEHQIWSYAVVAVILTMMALRFPSQGKFDEWAFDLERSLT